MIEKWTHDLPSETDACSPVNPEPSTPLAPSFASLNVQRALENLGSDEELYAEVVEAFSQGMAAQLDQLRQACGQADATQLSAIAHSLKGSAGNIGAEATQQLATQIENLVREGDTARALSLVPQMETCLGQLRDSIAVVLDGKTQNHV